MAADSSRRAAVTRLPSDRLHDNAGASLRRPHGLVIKVSLQREMMEPFSLYALGFLRENKAAQRILCPMASQLCHLILALERKEGISPAFPDLGEKAEKLAKATGELAAAARRLAEESGDEVYKEETHPTAKSLTRAGRSVLLVARELQEEPENPRHREEMAVAAKRVFTETVKILQMEDAAGARRTLEAASWLLELLAALRDTVGDVPALLATFRAFSEALLLLSNLTVKRLEELNDCPRRRSLAQTLQLLQERILLLHTAKWTELGHSHQQQVTLSKDAAFQLTERTIHELISLLVDEEPGDKHGTFCQHTKRLLALLSRSEPAQLSDGELSTHVDALIFYSMLLASSSRLDLKQELVERCWVLLRLKKSICSHLAQQEGRPGRSWGESSLEEECHSMREEVERLDQVVLTATLCQVLDTFLEEKEPLRQLVEDTLSLAGFPAGQGEFLKKLQPLTATFFEHAQQMLRAVDFVLARCPQTQTTRAIGEQVEHLKKLLASIPRALTETSGRAERLRSLCHTWAGTVESLLKCFEETVGTRELLMLAIQEMAKHQEGCEKALESQDPEMFTQHVAPLTRWARWVIEAATRYVDRATDPIFRNGLLVWVEQLASSLLQLKAVTALCPETFSCLQTHDVLSKAVSCLLETARHVRDGLDGSNHPDILSPLREQVRRRGVAEELDLTPSHAGLEIVTDEASSQEDAVSCPSSSPHPREGAVHPVVTALLAATGGGDAAAVDAACSALLELTNGCVEAAEEALPFTQASQLERQRREMAVLTRRIVGLAKETRHGCPRRLLRAALALSGRLRAAQAGLEAAADSWHRLSRQVLGFITSGDFPRGKQALEETMAGLEGAVRLAGDIASMALSSGNPVSLDAWESFLQVQAKFSHAQLKTRALLEKAASFQGSCRVGKATLELRCIQWAVGTHVLLAALDRFIGSDILLLRELRDPVKNKLCSQSLLAAVAENSLRLQEAAWLSSLSCPEDRGRREILVLREEMMVLMEALLDASNTLLVCPLPTASLDVRFELLQRDLALRAKALLLHLEKVNAEHLRVIREVLGPALAPLSQEDKERSKEAFEEQASRLLGNVRWVKTTLRDVLEGDAQEDLLPVAEHLLLLTLDVVGRASQLFQSHGDKGHHHLDTITWYWSAKANYLVTQLHAVRGISRNVLELVRRCLRNTEDRSSPGQHNGMAKLFSTQELDALRYTKEGETCLSRSSWGHGTTREAQETHQSHPPSISCASGPAKHQREDSETWRGGPSKMSQVTEDMAMKMLHMTQFLKKKGPITSKDQLVACAREMASAGQVLVRFGRALARHCPDSRCCTELLRAAEQTHTISSQLAIVARVKAVTAESKASSELLVSNAQNLTQAVVQVLKAAEAAAIKGLRQPPPGSEGEEVVAFCTQWRRTLSWHRASESLNPERDELGLRKTQVRTEPTLMAMVRGQPPQSKNDPHASNFY